LTSVKNYILRKIPDSVRRAVWFRIPSIVGILEFVSPLIVGSIVAGVILVLFWPVLLALIWSRFHAVQGYWWVRVITVIFLSVFAFLFHRIKQSFRRAYGVAEIVMGIVACWIVLRNLQADRMTLAIGLAAAVYFIVRGLDNYFIGKSMLRKGLVRSRRWI
jgi:hypothetical protein